MTHDDDSHAYGLDVVHGDRAPEALVPGFLVIVKVAKLHVRYNMARSWTEFNCLDSGNMADAEGQRGKRLRLIVVIFSPRSEPRTTDLSSCSINIDDCTGDERVRDGKLGFIDKED